ncbi:DUF4174 domain-containing protein [Marinobacter sp.]|uniref:DUF4174 domain-containing protein n=1 Tax=Marinobacter sp. TaxID=50741 RepID=UPI00384B7612
MNSLSDLQWKNRVLLIKASSDGSGAMEILNRYRQEIAERDIVWLVATDGDIRSNLEEVDPALAASVRETLRNQPGQTRVVLIGKDGGVRDRSEQLDPERLENMLEVQPVGVDPTRHLRVLAEWYPGLRKARRLFNQRPKQTPVLARSQARQTPE